MNEKLKSDTLRIAIDATPLMDRPLTGVGYRAYYILQALTAGDYDLDLRFFAPRSKRVGAGEVPFRESFTRVCTIPRARRIKTQLWTRFDWPPIEWFCGEVDVAHGLFHDLPPTRHAKRLVTIHDLSFLRHPDTHTAKTVAVQTRLVNHAIRFADGIVAVSESCKHELMEQFGFPEARIWVVPGGVRIEEFEGPFNADALEALKKRLQFQGRYFIHLGTIEPRKNLPLLLRAYRRLLGEMGEAPRLVLAGAAGWRAQPTFDAIKELGLNGHVLHAGYLSREDVVLLLRGAVALVYPSIYEGFGLPVLEGMAARVPVIASDAAALQEVAGGTCVQVPAQDAGALAAAMKAVLENPGAAESRLEPAFARAQTLTWKNSAATLAQVYRGLI